MYSKNIYCGLKALKTLWNDTSGCTCHRMMQSCWKNPVFIVSFWDIKFLRPNPLWKQFCEEKDAALAHRDNQIEALEFTNEEERQAHQQEILRLNEKISDLIANRHVARCGCFHYVLCLIKKNSGEVHPYYVIRCQYRQLEKHKQWPRPHYPNMEVADECDDPNAIHWWFRFKRKVIKKPNYYKNHFSLTEEKRGLLETALDVNI